MSKRYPMAKWTLPITIDPPRTCYTIPVPNDPYHRAAFRGALLALASATKWQDDPAHTAKEAAAVWKEIYDLVVECEESATLEGWDEDLTSLCESMRYNPATGLFEALCCGDWVAIDGQPSGGFSSSQPGAGGGNPAPGTCKSFHGEMPGGGLWLMPVNVSTGDTITVSGASGGTYDSDTLTWYCPDGSGYVLNACTGITSLKAGDPLPAVAHMKLIAKIGSTAYDVYTGSAFTVPAGISSQPVVFQVNDSTLTNDYGSLVFDVQVCNNASSAWTQVFDFTVNAYSSVWTINNYGSTPVAPYGVYVASTGYRTALGKFGAQWFRGIQLIHSKTYQQTSISVEFTYAAGTYGGNTADITYVQIVQPGSVRVNQLLMPTVPTSPKNDGVSRAVTGELIAINSGYSGASADPGGQVTLTKITITGTGTNPF